MVDSERQVTLHLPSTGHSTSADIQDWQVPARPGVHQCGADVYGVILRQIPHVLCAHATRPGLQGLRS